MRAGDWKQGINKCWPIPWNLVKYFVEGAKSYSAVCLPDFIEIGT